MNAPTPAVRTPNAGTRADGAAPARFRGVRKSFGERVVLDGIELEVPARQISVVIGSSGAGKSSLLRILLGLEPHDAGSVRLFGHEVAALGRREHARLMLRVGVLFQFGALFDSMSVAENVGFVLRHVRRLPEADVRRIVRENLLLVGLRNVDHLMPPQLSGGMRKRVALARAIAHGPELLLVDEPTSGVDPIGADAIHELIVQLRDRLGVTVLAISHDVRGALEVADRIAMLHRGRIVASGTPQELRRSPHEVVQQFVAGRAHGPITP